MTRAKNDARRSEPAAATGTREIGKAALEHVAEAWEIPEQELPGFEAWLRNLALIHDGATRSYGNCLTRGQKIKSLGMVETALRTAEKHLKDPWVASYMVNHERLAARSRKDVLTIKGELFESVDALIEERARRDVQAVPRLVKRIQAILCELENRDDNADEKKKKRTAQKPAREYIDGMILDRWERVLRRTDRTFEKSSRFVKAVAAIDKFLGLDEVSPKAIKARFKDLPRPNAEQN